MRSAGRDWIIGVADAIAVHRTMKVDGGDAVAMWLEHGFHRLRIRNIGRALVMNDQIVALSVIGIARDRQRRLSALVVGVNLLDDGVSAFLQSFFEDVLLPGIVMAAA